MAIFYQLLGTGIISYLSVTMAVIFTLPSAVFKSFASENTTLNRVMTDTELSLIGSVSYISMLIIIPFCDYLLDALGKKKCIVLFYISQLFGCLILVSIHTVEAFIFAMFLCGPCGCTMLVTPLYISEFCQENIRGSLTSIPAILYNFGILLSYYFGGVIPYTTIIYIILSMTLIGLTMLSVIKESPLFLMKKNREEEAAKSIAYFRGWKLDSKEVKDEIENIRRILTIEADSDSMPELEKLKGETKHKKKLGVLKYLVKSRSSRTALFVLLVLLTLVIFQGLLMVQTYAATILEVAVPNISGTLSSILFTVFIVVGSLIGGILVDVIGRRALVIFTSISTGLCCVILATQVQLHWTPDWLTAVFLYTYSMSFSAGAGCVPYVLIAEVFLPEIKGFASMLCMEWFSICIFSATFLFYPLVKAIGVGAIFYLFSTAAFFTALFAYFFLPETKGMPVDAIQEKFLKRNN